MKSNKLAIGLEVFGVLVVVATGTYAVANQATASIWTLMGLPIGLVVALVGSNCHEE